MFKHLAMRRSEVNDVGIVTQRQATGDSSGGSSSSQLWLTMGNKLWKAELRTKRGSFTLICREAAVTHNNQEREMFGILRATG